MQTFEVRPRFEIRTRAPAARLEVALRAAIRANTSEWATLPYAEFCVPKHVRNLWSPRLAICVHDPPEGEDELRLHCRFQPEPGIWTLYMALGAALAVAASVATAWFWAAWLMDGDLLRPSLALVVAIAAGLALFGASQWGQRKAQGHMYELSARLWRALDAAALVSTLEARHIDSPPPAPEPPHASR